MENQEEKLLRREFLKTLLVTSLSSLAILSNVRYLIELKPGQKERYLTITPEGYKIGVILGNHGHFDEETGKIDTQRATHLDVQDLFLPVGAFFNDGWINALDPRITGDLVKSSIHEAISEIPSFYKAPFEHGLSNNIPFIFGDINLNGVTRDQLIETSYSAKRAIISALATMFGKGYEVATDTFSNLSKRKVTRRRFLELLVAGGLMTSQYLSSPAYIYVARELGIKPKEQTYKDFQAIVSDLIHPDNYAIVMRNIVWALKCKDLFERGIVPEGKVINVLGGLDHRFLDFFLRNPELAVKYWRLFNYEKVASLLSGDISWVNHSRIFYPSTNKIETIHHKGLDILTS